LFLKKWREAGLKLFKFINVKNKRTKKKILTLTFEVFTMLANSKDPMVEYDCFEIFFLSMLYTFSPTQKVLDPDPKYWRLR
jgi:hypothetical protein